MKYSDKSANFSKHSIFKYECLLIYLFLRHNGDVNSRMHVLQSDDNNKQRTIFNETPGVFFPVCLARKKGDSQVRGYAL